MDNGYKIPTVLNNFNTYASGHKYVGVSSETTLPNFEYLTETFEGAGIAGEFEEAVEGCFASLNQKHLSRISGRNISFSWHRQGSSLTGVPCRYSTRRTRQMTSSKLPL